MTATSSAHRQGESQEHLLHGSSNFHVWVDAHSEGAWKNGLKPAQVMAEYRQVYELAVHLLKTYSGSGKSFYLGHWEGDNMLCSCIDHDSDDQMEE